MSGTKINGLYILSGSTVVDNSAASLVSKLDDSTSLWHNRLGHISEKGLHILLKQNLFGKDVISKLDFCDHCILGKHYRLSFNVGTHKSRSVLDYAHADLWGPAKNPTLGGKRYFLSIINNYSRKVGLSVEREK